MIAIEKLLSLESSPNNSPSMLISTNINQSGYPLIRGIVIALILALTLLLGGLLSYFAAFPIAQIGPGCSTCPFTMDQCGTPHPRTGRAIRKFCNTAIDMCVACP
jgi:hypothetical protein